MSIAMLLHVALHHQSSAVGNTKRSVVDILFKFLEFMVTTITLTLITLMQNLNITGITDNCFGRTLLSVEADGNGLKRTSHVGINIKNLCHFAHSVENLHLIYTLNLCMFFPFLFF